MAMINDLEKIPVVFGIDEKYVLQVFVVIRSILMHSSRQYHFFILTFDRLEDEVKRYTDILKREYHNFDISVRMVDLRRLNKAKVWKQHLSKATYLRLLISECIPEWDKCIYLDCDLIVYGDLKELFELDLENNYLAGVRDCHIIQDSPYEREHERILGIPSRDLYVNAGVLVMNLKKMRKDNLVERFLIQTEQENWYEDQDVLNYCCYPFIKILCLKYNLFHFYLGENRKFLQDCPYRREETDFDYETPFIVHLGGRDKPWNSFKVKKSKEWWEIAETFSGEDGYRKYRKGCCEEEKNDEIQNMIDSAQNNENIVVWGFSQNGKRLCDILMEHGLHIEAIADNNSNAWGQEYRGIFVKDFETVFKENRDVLWLISCQVSYGEVKRQLSDRGIPENNIIRYINHYEDILHLLAIDKHCYASEIEKIADMEYIYMIPDKNKRVEYIKSIILAPHVYRAEYRYLSEKYNFKYWVETVDMSKENDLL